jgi:NTE family protein
MTTRALVLGGGGVTGISWLWGVLAGLAERGVDLRSADLVIGTSAGSVVGAQVACGLDLQRRYEAQLEPADDELGASLRRRTLLRLQLAAATPGTPRTVRARIGRIALRARTVTEEERLEVVGARLPVHEWPVTPLQIVAVDAGTGDCETFARHTGASLVRAVTASCALPGVWPPVTIDGRRYFDGAFRSPVNADLARGYDRVVVLAPLGRGIGRLPSMGGQVADLRRASRVAVTTPDRGARAAMGRDLLDPARRAPAARAGRAQAAAVVDDVRGVWQ